MRARTSLAALFQPLRTGQSRPRRGGAPGENPAFEAIWHVICAIPRGQVATYGAVARAAGLPGRARQAGFALRVPRSAIAVLDDR
jgi:O6-methylguanine-DNA--protein-cysteine methyltransferase